MLSEVERLRVLNFFRNDERSSSQTNTDKLSWRPIWIMAVYVKSHSGVGWICRGRAKVKRRTVVTPTVTPLVAFAGKARDHETRVEGVITDH